jgi:hypothetical protein
MKKNHPGFVALTVDNCPSDFPESIRRGNHVGGEIWFKKREAGDSIDPTYARVFNDTLTLDPGANMFLTGYHAKYIILFSPGLSDEIKAWNNDISRLQRERDTIVNSTKRVKVFGLVIKHLESRFLHDVEVFDDLNAAKLYHTSIKKDEIMLNQVCSKNDFKIDQIYQRIERRVARCHKNANWFLDKFKYVLYPKFRADQDLLSRDKRNPLPKACKSVLSWMAHGRQRRELCHRMSLNCGVLVDPSEACSTILGSCCATMCSPGKPSFYINIRPVFYTPLSNEEVPGQDQEG